MTVYNFNPGPSALPSEVLERAKDSMFNYQNTGLSVLEMSHRSPLYEDVHFQAIADVRSLLAVPENYHILFLQGGASLQFAMLPMNFLSPGKKAGYILSGSWSEKAYQEASRIGAAIVLASDKDNNYRSIPAVDENHFADDLAYIHITSNNTIFGTQWDALPTRKSIPVCVDASSDIFSKPIEWDNVDLLYAGAQKNAGPSGVTIVIIRNEFLQTANKTVPKYLAYDTHVKADSLYNTPPTGSIYLLGLTMKWIKENGGVKGMEAAAKKKAGLLYDAIDASGSFYQGHADKASRSCMNVTFTLQNSELEKQFLQEAKARGFIGVNGHRSVGGCRASIYNAVPLSHVEALRSFMIEFQKAHA
ncbi:phosphoserine aminotransferase apoenzyme [Evansella caseinilytica]|uniref:Phosphoserine aminotransferase n=1 Tax=Evansella caseinilytica TaxID=1503961 RepID=A0A1H3K3F0_9BACI|nr:3-phosphoserine/phosphohydroxythreonine transaminase [Evansella caseinilytica]SDY46054.1 phosphoserine aminotransferase apoenzyme [Evansella caseinilytica]